MFIYLHLRPACLHLLPCPMHSGICLHLLPFPLSASLFSPVLLSASAPFSPLFVCLHLPSCLLVCTTTLMLPKVVTISASLRVACLYNYPDAPQSNYSATLCAACLYNLKIQDPAMLPNRLAFNASLRAALSVQLNSNAPQSFPHYCDYSTVLPVCTTGPPLLWLCFDKWAG
jgi:hypothetical protein